MKGKLSIVIPILNEEKNIIPLTKKIIQNLKRIKYEIIFVDDSSIDDSNKIRSSTGVIANWMSPIGPMNFVFSQNLSKASTDKTQSFSFNLGTTF